MADVKEMYAQQIDSARVALGRGDRQAAASSLRSAIDVACDDPSLQRELVSTLVHLGKLEQELGRPWEAERLLIEALEIGERLFGVEHASLGIVLNEMSRLHIRQSNHARAKAVLDRLLRIARTKGETHPDVATALAGLAIVYRGLGDDATAELRYREALRIREQVLAPNHMAIVVTLEQLSETCAARGNVAEALTLLRRALPTREAALGADHATVRAIRSRIATLELRNTPAATPGLVRAATPAAAADVAPLAAARRPTPVSAPVTRPNDLVFIYEPEPTPRRRASVPQQRVAPLAYPAPAVIAPKPVAAPPAPLAAAPIAAAPIAAAPIAAAPIAAALVAEAPISLPTKASAVELETLADVAMVAASDASLGSALPSTFAPPAARGRSSIATTVVDLWSSSNRTALFSSAGLFAVALAIALTSQWSSDAEGERILDQLDAEQPAAGARVALASRSAVRGAATTTTLGAELAGEKGAKSKAPAPATAEVGTANVTTPPAPTLPSAPRRLGALSVPVIATKNLDSLVRASTRTGRESYADQIGAAGALRTSPIAGETSGRPPVIIGSAPVPYFPDALRSLRTEGSAVVRFLVDERGRADVSSMKVVRSDHELFTLAVRNVLPRFRFHPARTAAPESKPRAEWVDFRADFTARN